MSIASNGKGVCIYGSGVFLVFGVGDAWSYINYNSHRDMRRKK